MIKVVTFKWNNGLHPRKKLRFGAEHVNRLRNMVQRNLSLPHEFICITDDPAGIDEDIKIIPLWNELRSMGGCYVRLKAFSLEMAEIIGPRFVWMDLDTVILDDITPILDRPEEFVAWGDTHPTTPYNGSMMMQTAGSRRQVWERFDRIKSPALGKSLLHVGTDQAWIGACLGPKEAKWGVQDGVYSFRCHIEKTGVLPPDARIVFFHGCHDPSQPETQAQHPWIKEHWR